MLLTTKALIDRAMQAELAYTIERLEVIANRPGNPFGVAIQTFGGATALAASHLPSPRFNRVVGMTAKEAQQLPEIMRWYEERRVSPRIEIRPGNIDSILAESLARIGFRQTAFHASLFGQITMKPVSAADIRVVKTPEMMEAFLAVYLIGGVFRLRSTTGLERICAAGLVFPAGISTLLKLTVYLPQRPPCISIKGLLI